MKIFKNQKKYRLLIYFSVFIVLATVILAILFSRHFFFSKTPLCKDCNVLLISLDTCGAKHMSLYGYERNTTPNLNALVKEGGIVFQHAYANATWTLPSHVSIFTGLYPFIHGVTTEKDRLSNTSPFLPDILHQHGYTTSFFLSTNDFTMPVDKVYNRGIDSVITDGYDTPEYFKQALNIISESSNKSFVFLHTYYCHDPYHFIDQNKPLLYTSKDVFPTFPTTDDEMASQTIPFIEKNYTVLLRELPIGLQNGDFSIAPEQIQMVLKEFQNAKDFSKAKQIYDHAVAEQWWGESRRIFSYIYDYVYRGPQNWDTDAKITYLKDLYDQGVTEMDTNMISIVQEAMKNIQFSKKTVVIITADHGEEFMEHGAMFHTTLYDNNTQVPMIFFIPGMQATSIQQQVQSVDIMPTLLDIVGIKTDFQGNGDSLVPLMQGRFLRSRLFVANGNTYRYTQTNIFTLRDGDWKVFVKKNDDNSLLPYELYNTKNDPNEEKNILAQNLQRAKNMIQRYQSVLKQ